MKEWTRKEFVIEWLRDIEYGGVEDVDQFAYGCSKFANRGLCELTRLFWYNGLTSSYERDASMYNYRMPLHTPKKNLKGIHILNPCDLLPIYDDEVLDLIYPVDAPDGFEYTPEQVRSVYGTRAESLGGHPENGCVFHVADKGIYDIRMWEGEYGENRCEWAGKLADFIEENF